MVKKLVYDTNGQNYRRIWKSPGSLRLFHIKNPVFFRRVTHSVKENTGKTVQEDTNFTHVNTILSIYSLVLYHTTP